MKGLVSTIAIRPHDSHEAGEVVSLSDYTGRPVVINFWFPSCPPCRLQTVALEGAFQTYKSNGVEFIGVQLLEIDSVDDGQDIVFSFNWPRT